ncbi:DUF2147 domain-containing protein [Parvularcula sp. LCG005]|uniref:DUF2147 domain-containing protein n=1 Tax=Parvularcula sp. LCG005 TaxID=3078805 RepID=UPI002942BCD1|nr:DUF2147 domain-containing protein [Parvularcula sp. LCG005]WOI53769.1 DUF2147 domain-containing protein [Parvularcula sp. LCG005]
MLEFIAGVMAVTMVTEPGSEADVFGNWFTPRRDSVIEIYDCGDETPCGRVIWMIDDQTGETLDTQNRDPDLRDRSILGMVLLEDFEPHDKGWTNGDIYNPEDGRTYRAKLKRLDDGTLEVKGCMGPICKGQVWLPAVKKTEPE